MHGHPATRIATRSCPQKNLTRIPKASALWFQKYFYADSKRHDSSYYKGLWSPGQGKKA